MVGTDEVVRYSGVEKAILREAGAGGVRFASERIPVLVVDSFPALGRLTALRFVEWVQQNPEGVVSLPTGKTPEHFIAWVNRLVKTWNAPGTRTLLERHGIDPARLPDLPRLHFVQIDEFYPIDPSQHNSFFHYVNKYYVQGFGLAEERCHLIDCTAIGLPAGRRLGEIWPEGRVDLSLRVRAARGTLESLQKETLARVDQWCLEHEDRIRALGGIGFFLGGIGPDGHIGFNVRGSDHHATTRLTETNYETQAAAATDLGGIEVSRARLVITIGLGTIAFNHACAAIIVAAGEAKAHVVADAVTSTRSILVPASALQGLPNARFYLTGGAARQLVERRAHAVRVADPVPDAEYEAAAIDTSVRVRKRLLDLTAADFSGTALADAVRSRAGDGLRSLLVQAHDRIVARIEAGLRVREGVRFLHTEPHHDDIMLGYLPSVVRSTRVSGNSHVFATLTSGFTAVTNAYMLVRLRRVLGLLRSGRFAELFGEGYFAPGNRSGRNRDVWQYLDGEAARSLEMRQEGSGRRLVRDLIEVFDDATPGGLEARIEELIHYFESAYPGKKDLPHIQRLKGMCREWEVECLWGFVGWTTDAVRHLRLGFYTGDIFTEEPTQSRDVPPIVSLLDEIRPDIVTLAFDPEASGPDTHYKVLQALAEALKVHAAEAARSDIRVWGYRNVWYRFHPSEANMYVPVSLNMFAVMESAFMGTFVSQKDASFPSHEHDGPFCELAQRIQTEQYQMLKTCLGRQWFHEHPSAMIRATRGFVFLREMALDELYAHSRELKRATENA